MFRSLLRNSAYTVLLICLVNFTLYPQNLPPRPQGIMKLDEIKEGMQGKAYSVLKGTIPVEYDVEILGRMPNWIGIGLDMLIVRLTGSNIEKTGIFSGMSGSPVYIDGKLAGSISFQLGIFGKEAIGGVTPAEYIMDVESQMPETKGIDPSQFLSNFENELFSSIRLNNPELQRILPGMKESIPVVTPEVKNIINKASLPLFISGLNQSSLSRLEQLIKGTGFDIIKSDSFAMPGAMPTAQSVTSADHQSQTSPEEVTAGGTIYIPLIRGDINIGASGTLTYVQDNKLFAFGHEFFRFGPVEWPVHRGRVLTVFPSDYESYHIVAPENEIGCIIEDRITGIYGVTDKRASMIPIEVQVRNKGTLIRKYNAESIQGRLAPILLWIMGETAVGNYFDLGRESTVTVKSFIQLNGDYNPVIIDNVFSGAGSGSQASILPAAAMYLLVTNQFEKVTFQNVKVTLDYFMNPLQAEITKVRYEKDEIAPGEKLSLKIYLRTLRGKTVVKTADLRIPKSFPEGRIKIVVGDANYVTNMENTGLARQPMISDLKHLINTLNSIKSMDTIYIQTYHISDGVFEYGRILNDLPPTALEIMTVKQANGEIIPLRYSLMSEDRLSTDYYVTGSHSFSINIKKKPGMEE